MADLPKNMSVGWEWFTVANSLSY